jgi:putative ABC transport system permease protein
MSGVLRDVRHALRWLRASPGVAIIAIATVALGIGATTAIFSVANAALIKPLPFVDSDRLALVYGTKPREGADLLPLSLPDFADFRGASRSFAQLAVWVLGRSTLTGGTEPELVQHAVVSAELLPLLGVAPRYGRTFRPQENGRGVPPVAIVSDGLWQRRFGADPSIIGKSLILDGQAVTVVGVLPASFRFLSFPNDTDIWLPLGQDSFVNRQYAREVRSVGAIGRLGGGVTWAAASAEAEAIAGDLRTRYPDANAGRSFRVIPLREQAARHARNGVLILMGAVGFVLLIACANVANLLLVRAGTRRREIAVRAAIGAGRGRIVRQLLTESVLLGVIGGGLGGALGTTAMRPLLLLNPTSIPRIGPAAADVAVDARVLVFAAMISIVTGLVFGILPAFQVSGTDLTTTLNESGRSGSGSRDNRARAALVIGEVAVAVVLLVGATLLIAFHLARPDDATH